MKILRHCYLLVAFLFAAGLGSVRAQSFEWSRLTRGAVDTAFVQSQASATDAAGDTYVAVSFTDSLRLGSILLTSQSIWAQAVVKYDATGAVVWAKALNNILVASLAADNSSAGGVFVVAANRGGGTWNGTTVPTTAAANFYAKCSAAGTLQWSNDLPAAYYFGGDRNDKVVADAAGNAYISGTVLANSTVAGTAVATSESFVLKANGAGTAQWVRVLHSTATAPINLSPGPQPGGGCLITGSLTYSNLYLGSGLTTQLLSGGNVDSGFIINFDAAGTPQWSNLIADAAGGTPQNSLTANASAADAAGNCYVTGGARFTTLIGTTTINAGFYLAKYNAAGALQWVRDTQPVPSTNFSSGTLLTLTSTGPTVVISAPNRAVVVGSLPLRSYYNFVHYSDQGLAQWTVADAWTSTSPAGSSWFQPTGLGSDASGNVYPVGLPQPSFRNYRALVQLGAQITVGRGTIVARLNAYANTLRGQVYFDQNSNGQQDAGEGVFPRQLTAVLTQGSVTTYSAVGTTGVLQAYAGTGAYSLTIPVPARYVLTQPSGGSYAGTFSGNNQLTAGQDFGIAPIANLADVRLSLVPYANGVRAGFTTSYRLTVENVGTTTVSGTASATFDSHLTYVSSTLGGTRTGQTVAWTYTNLAPFAKLEYDIILSLPTNVVVGTALLSSAAAPLTADVDLTNNTASVAQTVVGAYDPNSIEVNYPRITPAQVASREWLIYTIHFQNLGTAAATHVILTDTLDYRKLDLSTLTQLAGQSHNCQWTLNTTGTNNGLLTILFPNINLPERNVDVIRSQGFVQFYVRPRNTLTVGEVIPNHAGIVFDYNAPVLTNTATTTVFLATAAQASHNAPAWEAYPNPATDMVTVAADLATAGQVRVELLDMLGRPVRQQTLTAPAGPLRQTLDLRGLASGVYVLRLTPPTGPATSRQVVCN